MAAAARGALLPALAAAEGAAREGVLCAAGAAAVHAARAAVESELFHRGVCSAIAATRRGAPAAALPLEALLSAVRACGVEPTSREGAAAQATALAALALRAAADSGAPAAMADALDAIGGAAAANAVIAPSLADDVGAVAAACDAARAVAAVEAALCGGGGGGGGGGEANGGGAAQLTRAWGVAGEPGALRFECARGVCVDAEALLGFPQSLEAAVLDCEPPVAAALAAGLPPPRGLSRLLSLASAVVVMRGEALRCGVKGGGGSGGALAAAADAVAGAVGGGAWPWEGGGGGNARATLRAALRREAAVCAAHGAALVAREALWEALEGPSAPRVGALRLSLPPPPPSLPFSLRGGEEAGAPAAAPTGELLLPDLPAEGLLLGALDGALALADAAAGRGAAAGGELERLRATAAAVRAARALLAGGRYGAASEAAAVAASAGPQPPRAAEELALISQLSEGK